MLRSSTAALTFALLASPALAQETAPAADGPPPLIAEIKNANGESLGTATATATPSGLTLLTIELSGVAPGIHGLHVHETGTCTPPDFDSAGGHLAADKDHGVMSANGPHPGDLPNIHVPENGELTVEYFAAGLTHELMNDEDGSAIIIHDHPDDYVGQPTGHAGARLGCGSFASAS
ncbi:superoxide dismutase family protein [Paracoccus caeni]|uniref:Superoxide dismutase family protein n=1 Tax=Paracoccus caeni TaxID=657651 RepID=A0A934W1B6_9RHOB|nr:superoxide dismutase family protein [Paracoccus caeni]MBK4217233.1 superoxide dismutase family protein [Paracoccus caeni]